MSTSSIASASNQSLLLQQLMRLTKAAGIDSNSTANSAEGLQDQPTGTPSGPPPASGSTPADMFSPDTLSALTSAQADGTDPSQQMASNLAGQLVNQLDANGDGEVSLSEIQTALGSDATSSSDGLSSAFAQLDTDGDGQLSSGELTSGLQQMGTQGVHGHHGHHGHHGPPPTDSADATGSTQGDASASIATGAGSATDATSTDAAASSTTASTTSADSLQALMAQLAQYQYASLSAWAETQKQSQGVTA